MNYLKSYKLFESVSETDESNILDNIKYILTDLLDTGHNIKIHSLVTGHEEYAYNSKGYFRRRNWPHRESDTICFVIEGPIRLEDLQVILQLDSYLRDEGFFDNLPDYYKSLNIHYINKNGREFIDRFNLDRLPEIFSLRDKFEKDFSDDFGFGWKINRLVLYYCLPDWFHLDKDFEIILRSPFYIKYK